MKVRSTRGDSTAVRVCGSTRDTYYTSKVREHCYSDVLLFSVYRVHVDLEDDIGFRNRYLSNGK